MGKNVIITGSTGMVGEGVARVCIDNQEIDSILLISRRPSCLDHPKVKEVLIKDFLDLSGIESELTGYDACLHCMGISSVGIEIEQYKVITQDMTLNLGKTLSRLNKDMTFMYVSGGGTDNSGNAKMAWSRIKGKTENMLSVMGFAHYYSYRPGFILPYKGQQNAHNFYKYINWMFPLGKMIYLKGFSSMEDLGLSMIQLTLEPSNETIIDGTHINKLARRLKKS